MSKKSWFFVADWHLNHGNVIKYTGRPFLSAAETKLFANSVDFKVSSDSVNLMTKTIIDNTNAVVGENDTLVHNGDLLFAPRDELFERLREYRKRIVCCNVILIFGNHDKSLFNLYYNTGEYSGSQWVAVSAETRQMFPHVYHQIMFNVDGQKIWVDHYPHRSWDCAYHQSWSLYGHVHNAFRHEDNGLLSPYVEHTLADVFTQVLGNHYGTNPSNSTITELLDAVAALNGVDLTLDIGVDNTIRGDKVPWGTPWSMEDLHKYMSKKRTKWLARQDAYKALS